ncbi:MAG: VWA domain-containing protein [Actinobacteria bacterium]|nr:VWA domain-containing protein [Actinomycetota bacterium]
MTFLAPGLLWLLLLVVAVVALYVVLLLRRPKYAVRFTNVELLKSVAPRRPGWRRHLPAALVLAALILLALGLAKPVHETQVAKESEIVMLNIDVSRSMSATDVSPTRLAAATEAAADFVSGLPEGVQVGLVAFSDTADLLVAPTADRQQVEAAIADLEPVSSTATGDAIITSLNAIESAERSAGVTPQEGDTPAAIVLLADGDQKVGVPLEEAAAEAADAGVPVNTITFGTQSGTVTVDGMEIPVPPNPQAMAELADATGGEAFDARNSDELRNVYSQIQGEVGFTTEDSDLWPWFVAAAFVLLLLGASGAIIWTGRFL